MLLNPNFWVCQCPPPGNVHNSLLEGTCEQCEAAEAKQPRAWQRQVNDHADWVAEQQKAAKNRKHELPQPRKKDPPTRQEFEAALDYLEAPYSEVGCSYETWLNRKKNAELTIKRYKHHHA